MDKLALKFLRSGIELLQPAGSQQESDSSPGMVKFAGFADTWIGSQPKAPVAAAFDDTSKPINASQLWEDALPGQQFPAEIACDIPGPLDDPQGVNGWAGVLPSDPMAPVLDDPQGANGWAGVFPAGPCAPALDDPQGANGWAGVMPTDPMAPILDDPQGANGWAGVMPTDPMAPVLDDPQGANGWAGVQPTDPMIGAVADPDTAGQWTALG
jgi:hypothetical protein